MARRRVKLAFIENDSSRRVTYKKRVKGLVKKTQELSVLCGVDVCTIVYGPYDQAPVVWPSSEAEARRIITAFKRKPEVDQCERQLDQETYVKVSLNKAQEKLAKLQRRNREMELENVISDMFIGKLTLEQIPPTHTGELVWVIDDKLRSIEHRIKGINNNNNNNNNNNPTPNSSINENNGYHNATSTSAGNENPLNYNPCFVDGDNQGFIRTNDASIDDDNDVKHSVILHNEDNHNSVINPSAIDGVNANVINTIEEEEIHDVKNIITSCPM